MKLGVFEFLFGINEGLEKAITHLQSLETMEPFGKTEEDRSRGKASVAKFRMEAERLRAGINRYLSEQIGFEADEDAVRLDPLVTPPEKEET